MSRKVVTPDAPHPLVTPGNPNTEARVHTYYYYLLTTYLTTSRGEAVDEVAARIVPQMRTDLGAGLCRAPPQRRRRLRPADGVRKLREARVAHCHHASHTHVVHLHQQVVSQCF